MAKPQSLQTSDDARIQAKKDSATLAALEEKKKALRVRFAAHRSLRKETQNTHKALLGKKISALNGVDNG